MKCLLTGGGVERSGVVFQTAMAKRREFVHPAFKVVADLFKVVPELTEKLKAAKAD